MTISFLKCTFWKCIVQKCKFWRCVFRKCFISFQSLLESVFSKSVFFKVYTKIFCISHNPIAQLSYSARCIYISDIVICVSLINLQIWHRTIWYRTNVQCAFLHYGVKLSQCQNVPMTNYSRCNCLMVLRLDCCDFSRWRYQLNSKWRRQKGSLSYVAMQDLVVYNMAK